MAKAARAHGALKSESEEHYLKAMLALLGKGGSAKTTRLALELRIAPSSATQMLSKLSRRNLVKRKSYRGATLTQKGRREAEAVLRRYLLLEKFLRDRLSLPPAEASRQACLMEHCLTKGAERRICALLGMPAKGSGGETVPGCRLSPPCPLCARRQSERRER